MYRLENKTKSEEESTVVFKALPGNQFYINSPCFLTSPARTIRLNGSYLKSEGSHFDAIRLINVRFAEGFVHLLVEDLKTKRVYPISHIVGEKYPCFWWLLGWEYIENDVIRRIKCRSDKVLSEIIG